MFIIHGRCLAFWEHLDNLEKQNYINIIMRYYQVVLLCSEKNSKEGTNSQGLFYIDIILVLLAWIWHRQFTKFLHNIGKHIHENRTMILGMKVLFIKLSFELINYYLMKLLTLDANCKYLSVLNVY